MELHEQLAFIKNFVDFHTSQSEETIEFQKQKVKDYTSAGLYDNPKMLPQLEHQQDCADKRAEYHKKEAASYQAVLDTINRGIELEKSFNEFLKKKHEQEHKDGPFN